MRLGSMYDGSANGRKDAQPTDKRLEARPEARGRDNRIGSNPATTREEHFGAIETFNGGNNLDSPVLHGADESKVDNGADVVSHGACIWFVIRAREAVFR